MLFAKLVLKRKETNADVVFILQCQSGTNDINCGQTMEKAEREES